MIQRKGEELPFDYRQAQYLIPSLYYQDYASAFELFSGLSEHVTLHSEYDDSLAFVVNEDKFWGVLNTEAKTIRYYQVRNKTKVKHRIPLRLLEALRARMRGVPAKLQVGAVDDYVVFTDVLLGTNRRWEIGSAARSWPYLCEPNEIIAWCKYTKGNDYDDTECKACGFVDGLALLKHPALKHGDIFAMACDNRHLWLNSEVFEKFEQCPHTETAKLVSVSLPRFTFARILIRMLRFARGLCIPYIALSEHGVKIVVPDAAFFVRAS